MFSDKFQKLAKDEKSRFAHEGNDGTSTKVSVEVLLGEYASISCLLGQLFTYKIQ